MDWLGQLDNLTKLIAVVILGLAIALALVWSWYWMQGEELVSLRNELSRAEMKLYSITADRDELEAYVNQLLEQFDAQDPAGPARAVLEELRRRQQARFTS